MPTLEQIGTEKYASFTTFRKDGRAVPTPVWVLPAGTGVAIWTVSDSWKVKRARNNPRVTVAACDVRGNVRGEAIEAHARIGDHADRRRIGEGLKRKYGLVGRLSLLGSKLRRGEHGTLAILVS